MMQEELMRRLGMVNATIEPIASLMAGLAYAGSVFAVGFVLGALRVILVAPRVGQLAAVLIEMPIILAISWLLCGPCMRRFKVPPCRSSRTIAGAFAFAVLQLLELTLAITLFRESLGQYAANLRTPAGTIGMAAQGVFALFPLLQARRPVLPPARRRQTQCADRSAT